MMDHAQPISDDRRGLRPRWHRLYLLLAGFDIVTVLFSLIVSYRIVQIYRQSVADNLSWVEQLQTVNALSEKAADLNTPGNNVFESNDIAAEDLKVRQESAKFAELLQGFRRELRAKTDTESIENILRELSIVETAAGQIAAQAALVFQRLGNQQRDEAARHMAVMDRQLTSLHRALDRIRSEIGSIQRSLFDQQTAQAAWLQRFEYLIGGLMILMVIAAVLYAQRIRRLEIRHRQQGEMIQAARQRTALLKQVMLAHEEERRVIARELHDGVGQSLTSLLVGLRTLEEAAEIEPARDQAARLRQLTGDTLQEVRQIARGLRPGALDDLGLAAALERLVVDFSKLHGLPIDLQLIGLDSVRLPEAIETTLYRIIQEALTNVAKYAHAHKVGLVVERRPGVVRATVEDDGRGFDPVAAQRGDSFGLTSMQERAALHAGSLTIQSQPGHGAKVIVSIPLAESGDGKN